MSGIEAEISENITTERGSARPRRVTENVLEEEIIIFENAHRSDEEVSNSNEESQTSEESESTMTSDSDSVKSEKGSSSRVPKFRKDADWDMFEHKFLAYAEDKNFIDVIERKHPLLPDAFDGDLTAIADKNVRKVLKQNRKAVLAFSEALGDSISFSCCCIWL
jgi:hypothetical protein